MTTSNLLWAFWGSGIALLIVSAGVGTLAAKWLKSNSDDDDESHQDEPIDPAAGLYRDGAIEDSEPPNRP